MDWKSVTKRLRFRLPSATVSAAASDESSDDLKQHDLKPFFSQPLDSITNPSKPKKKVNLDAAAIEYFVADLFAAISAIKASYAQLQLAQSPYDPDSIQSADRSVVSELKRISDLKQSYLNKDHLYSQPQPFTAQINEQKNLIKTFQITINKLESEIRSKDDDLSYLRSKLSEIENKNRVLESKIYPKRSLASLYNLHISALNPNHLLIALRFAVKSIRSFAKIMANAMDSAGWDLNAAAAAIHGIELRPEHRSFAFESFFCCKMFSDFHRKDFNFDFMATRSKWDRRDFFEEFDQFKFLKPKEILDRRVEFGKFCRGKYRSLVHPKMEAAIFGGSDSGRGLSDPGFYNAFVEMSRRVWLLHCLFFSFAPELNGSVFQARSGSRFSEVFMVSVADPDPDPIAGKATPTALGDDHESLVGTLVQLQRLTPTQLIHAVKDYRAEVGEKSLPKAHMKFLVQLQRGEQSLIKRPLTPMVDTPEPGMATPTRQNGAPVTVDKSPVTPQDAAAPSTSSPVEQDTDPPLNRNALTLDQSLMLPFSLPTSTDMLITYGAGIGGVNRERARKYIPTVPTEVLSRLNLDGEGVRRRGGSIGTIGTTGQGWRSGF